MHSRLVDGLVLRPLRGSMDGHRHALAAYQPGDRNPVGIARLVRDGDTAEVFFDVADEQVAAALGEALADDARAAGITKLHANGQPLVSFADGPGRRRRATRRARALRRPLVA